MMENKTTTVTETIIRFFSFFTILTNTLAAIYFTTQIFNYNRRVQAGTLTAITVYILIVGFVYQVMLRHIWEPTGLQMIVDELLHSINPLLVILYWYLYEEKQSVKYKNIVNWLIFPFVYLIIIFMRGKISGFFPYPFINVNEIGFLTALTNSSMLLIIFTLTSLLFIMLLKYISKKESESVIMK